MRRERTETEGRNVDEMHHKLVGLRSPSKKKLNLNQTACDDPLMPEIFDCIAQPWGLQLPAEGQQESHPADFKIRCRVRVALKGADGLPINPEVPDRKTLFLKVAELLPRHPNRSPEAVARRKAEEAAARAAAAREAKAQGGGGGGGAGGGGSSSSSQQGTQQRSSSKKKGRK